MSIQSPTINSRLDERVNHLRTLAAFRNVKLLAGGYFVISLLTLAAIILLHNNIAGMAPVSVWVRGIIVVVHAGVTLGFTARMARGSRAGLILLRISSAGMLVAIAVILAIPGDFPLWFKIEQGICGLLLLGVVVLVNGKRLRSAFATK